MKNRFLTLLLVSLICTSYGPPNCNIYKHDQNCYQACLLAEKAITYNQGEDKSQKYFDKSIALCSTFDYSYYEKAVPFAKRGLMREWKEMIDIAVKINPREHLRTRGWYHFFFMNNYEAAIKDIEEVRQIFKGNDIGYTGNGDYHLNIMVALCYKKLGKTDKAIETILTQLADKNHQFGVYDYLHLGVLYLENKEYQLAIEKLDVQKANSDLSEIYYYKALAYKGLKMMHEYKINLGLAKEYYLKEKTMENPYRQMIDEIYLADIENEILLSQNEINN
jgi:tetratricopeptide (TPR) repeat protein